jgi:hypothetical protein
MLTMSKFLALLIAACCCLSGVEVFAQDAAAPNAESAHAARLARIQALRAQRPQDGLLIFYEAMARSDAGQREAALDLLRSLRGRRLGLLPTQGIGFDALWADAEFQRVRQDLIDDEPRSAQAPVALALTDARLIPEGVAHDARSGRFFLGSLPGHKVVVVSRGGKLSDFSRPTDELDAVLGLAVDERGRRLCGVSTNGFEASGKAQRRNAVVCWDVRTASRLARHDIPAARQLNDLAFAPDGSIVVSDSEEGSLWRLRRGDAAFSLLGARGALPGANGVAVAPDGAIFVTLSTGIARVDPADGRVHRIDQPDDVVSGGIDGLYWWRGRLIGVQNTPNPGRVIELQLDASGQSIAGMRVLQSHHHPEFDEPTTGALVGDTFYVLANSYVTRYQPDGSIQSKPQPMKGTRLLRIELQR